MSPNGTAAEAAPVTQEAYAVSAMAQLYPPPLRLEAGRHRRPASAIHSTSASTEVR